MSRCKKNSAFFSLVAMWLKGPRHVKCWTLWTHEGVTSCLAMWHMWSGASDKSAFVTTSPCSYCVPFPSCKWLNAHLQNVLRRLANAQCAHVEHFLAVGLPEGMGEDMIVPETKVHWTITVLNCIPKLNMNHGNHQFGLKRMQMPVVKTHLVVSIDFSSLPCIFGEWCVSFKLTVRL